MTLSLTERVVRSLCRNDRAFYTRSIPHGRQIKFDDRSVLMIYDTGKRHWQGAPTTDRKAIDALIVAANRAHNRNELKKRDPGPAGGDPPGIFDDEGTKSLP